MNQKSIFRAGLCALLGLGAVVAMAAEPPQWWADKGVLNSEPAQDDAAANQGQLMYMASKAALEFQEKVPLLDRTAIDTLIAEFSSYDPANYSVAATLGQLKYVAQPFYDVLDSNGLQDAWPTGMGVGDGPYPWSQYAGSKQDHALANLGQLKYVFSFDLDKATLLADSDGDGMPDEWEVENGFNPYRWDADNDPDRDGFTNVEEFQNGTDPRSMDVNRSILPYATGFEPAEAYVPGDLNHQNDWIGTIGKTSVQDSNVESGSQAVSLDSDAVAAHYFDSSATTVEATAGMYLSSVGSFPPSRLPANASTLICYDPDSGLMAFDGNGDGDGTWILVAGTLLPDQWVTITIVQDYGTKTWSVDVVGYGNLSNLGFRINDADSLESIVLENGAETQSGLDSVSIQ